MAIPEFLQALLTATGPSGYETPAADVWRESARSFSEEVSNDTVGSSVALVSTPADGAPLIGLVGHIDEIGLVVKHITEEGVLRFGTIGGWDPQILVGQRVTVQTANGPLPGVVGRKPIHLLEEDDRKQVAKFEQMYIDVGATSRDDAARLVSIGDPAVIAVTPLELANGRVASKAMDNRLGAYIVLEAARRVASEHDASRWGVAAVAAAQEETTFAGARTSAFALDLQACIVVDVTFASDIPDSDLAKTGEAKLGHGVQIARGANLHPKMTELLIATAEAENIPYTVAVPGRNSGTDADAIHFARAGVPCGLVSVPLRYMHSPVETVQLADVEYAIELLAATCMRLDPAEDFRR
jgi:putative aminopeptidase FrvX